MLWLVLALILAAVALFVSGFALRVAIGAARSVPAETSSTEPKFSPRYIGDKAP